MKTLTIVVFILAFCSSSPIQAEKFKISTNSLKAGMGTEANASFNAGTNALEISMQSNGKPESVLVYVSRSNGTVVHFEYVTITSETKILKIDLSDEDAGLFNLRLNGKSMQYSYAFKKSTP